MRGTRSYFEITNANKNIRKIISDFLIGDTFLMMVIEGL